MSDPRESLDAPVEPQPTNLHALGLRLARGRLRLLTLNLLLLLIPLAAALAFAFYGRSDRVYLNNQIEIKRVSIQNNLQVKLQKNIDKKVIPDAHAYIDRRLQELLQPSPEDALSEGTLPEPVTAGAASGTVDPRVDSIERELREGSYAQRIQDLERLRDDFAPRLLAVEKQLGLPLAPGSSNSLTMDQRLRDLEARLGARPQGDLESLEARVAGLAEKIRSIENANYGVTVANLERRLNRLDPPDSPLEKRLDGLEKRVTVEQLGQARTSLESKIKERADEIQKEVNVHKSDITALKLRESRVLILKENSEEFEIDGLDFNIKLGKILESSSGRSLEVTITRGAESVFRRSVGLGKSASFKYRKCDYSLLVFQAASVPLLRDYLEVIIDQRCAPQN